MSRTALVSRRLQLVETMWFDGREYEVCFGFEPGCPVREVFIARGPKVGSQAATFFDDSAIMVSLLLQHGYTADGIARRLTMDGAWRQILRRAAELDAEMAA